MTLLRGGVAIDTSKGCMMLRTVVATACFCVFDVAFAAPVPLSGKSLSELIAGAVVDLDTPLGTKLSITYGNDGRMSGQAGALAFYLGASRDKGKWWVASDMLCQKWETWFNTETQCMRIKKEGPRIHWASRDGKTGTGTVHLKVAAAPEAVKPVKNAARPASAVDARPAAAKAVIAAGRTEPMKPNRVAIATPPTPPATAVEKAAEKPAEIAVDTVTETATAFVETQVAPEMVPVAPTYQPRPVFSRLTGPYFAPLDLAQAPEIAPQLAHRESPSAAESPAGQSAKAGASEGTSVTIVSNVEAKETAAAKPATKVEVKPARSPQSPRPPQQMVAKPAPPMPAPPMPAEPMFKVVNVRGSDVLNVRGGPSGDHDVVGSIPPRGRGVAVTGECRSRWCPVKHQDVTGWVNKMFLESEDDEGTTTSARNDTLVQDNPEAPRGCLSSAAKDLLGRIEAKFGAMQLVSTCRSGATIAGTGRPSRHRTGNAIDFKAGARKQAVVDWLVANHSQGGTMTYRDMDHIHVDIGPHFVALGSGARVGRDWSAGRMGVTSAR